MRMRITMGVVVVIGILPVACTQPAPQKRPEAATSPKAPRVERPDAHWVQDAELRKVMKELASRMARNTMKDMPQDPEDQQSAAADLERAMESAARLADGLATGAVRIPDAVANVTMSEADRAGFRAESDTLREQALRLRVAARAGKVEQVQQAFDHINATCISCHSRYRDFSGQLQLQQLSSGN